MAHTTKTQTAEQYLNKFANLMSSAGYEITEIMQEALLEEFANCAEADEEDGSMDSLGDFLTSCSTPQADSPTPKTKRRGARHAPHPPAAGRDG